MKRYLGRIGVTGDSGSALVATLGVALIGMAFSLIVVTQAISITNDAARDRVRTVEIHAAEAALDAAFQTIETSTPCTTTMTVAEDSSYEVAVEVTIRYFNASGDVTCTNGVLGGIPTGAELTSSALPVNEAPGAVVPHRQMQAKVNLVPVMEPTLGVALFSGGTMSVSNSGSISPLDPNEPARVWVEDTDFVCNNSFDINADLIVTEGSITMNNTCVVTGNAWARDGMVVNNNVSPFRVGGDVVVYNGNLTNNQKQNYGGNVSIGGDITGAGLTAVGSICSDNVGSPCGVLQNYLPRGLPTVTYEPSDWPSSFVVKQIGTGNTTTPGTWVYDVVKGAGLTGSTATQFAANPCLMTNKIKNPIVLTAQDSIYDLRTCQPLESSNSVSIVINADTAFFVDGFKVSNQFTISSGDGEQHDVWFIVPTGYTGDISMSNSEYIIPPIHVFLFTPNDVQFANTTDMVGQTYGTNITLTNGIDFQYAGMGIPGVELGDPTASSTAASYSVEIVNKHEIRND